MSIIIHERERERENTGTLHLNLKLFLILIIHFLVSVFQNSYQLKNYKISFLFLNESLKMLKATDSTIDVFASIKEMFEI